MFRWADIQKNVDSSIELIDSAENVSKQYVIGCDLAKYQDYTVIIVLDVTEKPYRLGVLLRAGEG